MGKGLFFLVGLDLTEPDRAGRQTAVAIAFGLLDILSFVSRSPFMMISFSFSFSFCSYLSLWVPLAPLVIPASPPFGHSFWLYSLFCVAFCAPFCRFYLWNAATLCRCCCCCWYPPPLAPFRSPLSTVPVVRVLSFCVHPFRAFRLPQ